jgi:hypothetical protein
MKNGKFITVPFDKEAVDGQSQFARNVRIRIRVLMAIGPRSGL